MAGFWAILVAGIFLILATTWADYRSSKRSSSLDSSDLGLHADPKSGQLLGEGVSSVNFALDTPSPLESVAPSFIDVKQILEHKKAPIELVFPAEMIKSFTRLPGQLADLGFINTTDRACLIDSPLVLVCVEEIKYVAEIAPILSKVSATKNSLVVAAVGFSTEVLKTPVVNHMGEVVEVVGLIGSLRELYDLAGFFSASPRTREDLQAGSVGWSHLGKTADRLLIHTDHVLVLPESVTNS